MSLPKVFAIYRRDSETFQLLTCENDENGNILRLRNWTRPYYSVKVGEEDEETKRWHIGTEWYVEPDSEKECNEIVHSVEIHGKVYNWWSLSHTLIWSSYMIYHNRNDVEHSREAWNNAPRIPIIEFNSKHIYPRMDVLGFYPRWASVTPEDIELSSQRIRAKFLEESDYYEHIDPKDLRIRTPKPDDKGLYSTDEENDITYNRDSLDVFNDVADRCRICMTSCILSVMVCCFLGTYIMIGTQLYGY